MIIVLLLWAVESVLWLLCVVCSIVVCVDHVYTDCVMELCVSEVDFYHTKHPRLRRTRWVCREDVVFHGVFTSWVVSVLAWWVVSELFFFLRYHFWRYLENN